MSSYFLNKKKQTKIEALKKKFIKDGFVIFDINKDKLNKITNFIQNHLKKKKILKNLNLTHKSFAVDKLNDLRMDLNFKLN